MSEPDSSPPEPDDAWGLKAAARALTQASEELTRRAAQAAATEANEAVSRSLNKASDAVVRATQRATKGPLAAAERRLEKAERTRADLLTAAAALIAERGYEGASVGDIAAAAGFTKGAIYTHFGSKEEMFLELARITLAGSAPLPDDADQDTLRLLLLEIWLYGARHPESTAVLAPAWQEWIIGLGEGLCGQVPRATPLSLEQFALAGAAVTLMMPLAGVLMLDDQPGRSALAAMAVLAAATPENGQASEPPALTTGPETDQA